MNRTLTCLAVIYPIKQKGKPKNSTPKRKKYEIRNAYYYNFFCCCNILNQDRSGKRTVRLEETGSLFCCGSNSFLSSHLYALSFRVFTILSLYPSILLHLPNGIPVPSTTKRSVEARPAAFS